MPSQKKTNVVLQHKAHVKKSEKKAGEQQESNTRSHRFFATDEITKIASTQQKNASRFAHALEEINRRLLSQQLVWFSLW